MLAALIIAAALTAFAAVQLVVRSRRDDAQLLHALVEGTSDAVFVKDLEGRYVLANDAAATLIGHPREAIVGRTDADLCPRDETEMRRLEEDSGRFFDLAPDMLCAVGPNGYLERVNRAWTAVLGWTADELRARPLLDFVHPEDRAALADGRVQRLATRSGGWRDVEWTARAERDRTYAVGRDVTDRKHMQSALAASEARYRELVHSLPSSSVVAFDHDLRFTFAAGAALAETGLDGDVVGRTLAEVLPHAASALTPRYRSTLAGHTQSFELAGRDGRHYRVQMTPLRDGEGAIEGGVVLAQDVTAVSHFRTAFEQSPIGSAVVAPDGRHLRVNDALCRITGYDADELLATTVDAITLGAPGHEDLLSGRVAALRTERRYARADGQTVVASVHATLVRDAAGNPSHILDQVAVIECTGGSAAATSNQLAPASPEP